MKLPVELVALLVLAAVFLVALVSSRPGLATSPGGKLLIFAALFLLPVASIRSGLRVHMQSTKSTEFCMSCHVMEPFGQGLLVEDETFLPAAHFQNRRIDRDTACFSCHTHYSLFGDMAAKLNGLKHMAVYYSGQTPDVIELYKPYNNRECLYCHEGARSFEDLHDHDRKELIANEMSCMSCHGKTHEVHALAGEAMWQDDLMKTLKGGRPD
jgi:cytochrome c-type protein NapC